jgi:peptidoglycan/LPS O-acetylase OafA/YrhL
MAVRGRKTAHGSTWWPALEGLRGFGLMVLLIGHHDPDAIAGAFLTVSMFFTLSGFLITTLLLREREKTGRIAIKAFWFRRARRLLPTAMVGLLLASLVAYATRSSAVMGSVASDIKWAALNMANWRFVSTHSQYAEVMAVPSTVGHYWSLAIEEQYYLIYPLLALLALRFGRRGLGMSLGVLTIGSMVAQIVTHGGDRAYYGTDTRLAEIAIGGLAAVLWAGPLREKVEPYMGVIGPIAGAGAFAMWATLPLDSPFVFRGGVVLHATLSSAFMIALTTGGWLGRPLEFRPLQWLGKISYAAYVVHLPIYLYLDADRVGFGGIGLLLVRTAATLVVSALVVQLVEDPVRTGQALRSFRWQAPLATACIVGVVLLVATSLPEVGRKPSELELFTAGRQTDPKLVTAPVPDVVELPDTVPDATSTTVAQDQTTSPQPNAAPVTTAPQEPARALKLLAAGDSTAGAWGAGMQQWGAAHGFASVDRSGGPGCVLFAPGKAYLRPGWVYTPTPGCAGLTDLVISDAKQSQPDAMVLIIGSMQMADWVEQDGAPAFSLGDPSYDARYRAAFSQALDRFTAELRIPILVATIPTPDWQPTNAPGEGPMTANNPARTRRLNEINRSVVQSHPGTRMVDFAGYVSLPDGHVDPALHPDGLHIDPNLVPGIMDRGLADEMRAAYRSVLSANAVPRRPGRTIWWP